jgi:hypothetical protein
LNFPFEVETVAGAAALGRRDALLAEGCYPVIAGSPDNLEPLIQGYESSARGGACLEAVKGIDVDDWLARRLASWMSDPEYHEEHGDWPSDWSSEVDPTRAFTGPTDIVTGELLAEVAIVLVPTSESWHVPCLVGYGDWNACPAPPVPFRGPEALAGTAWSNAGNDEPRHDRTRGRASDSDSRRCPRFSQRAIHLLPGHRRRAPVHDRNARRSAPARPRVVLLVGLSRLAPGSILLKQRCRYRLRPGAIAPTIEA